MSSTPNAAIVTPRDDIGLFFDSIDLDSVRMGFIGFQLAPVIEATLRRGEYSYRSIAQVLQKYPDASRTDEGGFKRIRNQFSRKSFAIGSRGLEEPVDNATEAEYLGMIDLDLIAAQSTRHGVLEDHESRVIEKINAVTPAATLTGTDQWHDDSSDPVKQISIWKRDFRLQCGEQPNTLTVDETVVDQLAVNPAVVEAAGRVGSNLREALEFNDVNRRLRLQAIAVALGLSQIIESKGMLNEAAQPKAASLATTFPETKAVLTLTRSGNNTRERQWLRTAHWSANGSRPGCVFEEYDEPRIDSRVIRHRMDDEILVINSECVMVIDDVIDTTELVVSGE